MCTSCRTPLERVANAILYRTLVPMAREGIALPDGKSVEVLERMDAEEVFSYSRKLLDNNDFWLKFERRIEKFEAYASQRPARTFIESKLKRAEQIKNELA